MTKFFSVIMLLSLYACEDTSGLSVVFLIAGNSPAGPEATVIVTRDSDTLYNTTFPPGAHSCGDIPSGPPVTVTVLRTDTTATFASVPLTQSAIRIQSYADSVTVRSSTDRCY